MAKELQIRRGTTQANDLFIGKEGELSMDTTTKGLRIHDGQTAGGFKIDTVVDFQVPTSSNNYTWYRKYSSGWVEQGGYKTSGAAGATTITLPVEMASISFFPQVTRMGGSTSTSNIDVWARQPTTTTSFTAYTASDTGIVWEVRGMAA